MEIRVFIGVTVLVFMSMNSATTGTSYKRNICEGDAVNLQCANGQVLAFDAANYGRTNSSVCGHSEVSYCVLPETVSVLNQKCFGKNECLLKIDDSLFKKDPCPGTAKYLEVAYSCVPESDVTEACSKYMIKLGSHPSGYIKSKNYPGLYNEKSDCVVKLKPRLGFKYDLTLLDLDVQNRVGTGCYDWLIVKDEENPGKHFNYCGKYPVVHTDEPIKAEQVDNVAVMFNSDAFADRNRGFVIKYQEVPEIPIHMEF